MGGPRRTVRLNRFFRIKPFRTPGRRIMNMRPSVGSINLPQQCTVRIDLTNEGPVDKYVRAVKSVPPAKPAAVSKLSLVARAAGKLLGVIKDVVDAHASGSVLGMSIFGVGGSRKKTAEPVESPTKQLFKWISEKYEMPEILMHEENRESHLPLWIDLGSLAADKLARMADKYRDKYHVIGIEESYSPKEFVRYSFRTGYLKGASYIFAGSRILPANSADVVTILFPNNMEIIDDGLEIVRPGGEILIVGDAAKGHYQNEVTQLLSGLNFKDVSTHSREAMNNKLGGALDLGAWNFHFGITATKPSVQAPAENFTINRVVEIIKQRDEAAFGRLESEIARLQPDKILAVYAKLFGLVEKLTAEHYNWLVDTDNLNLETIVRQANEWDLQVKYLLRISKDFEKATYRIADTRQSVHARKIIYHLESSLLQDPVSLTACYYLLKRKIEKEASVGDVSVFDKSEIMNAASDIKKAVFNDSGYRVPQTKRELAHRVLYEGLGFNEEGAFWENTVLNFPVPRKKPERTESDLRIAWPPSPTDQTLGIYLDILGWKLEVSDSILSLDFSETYFTKKP